MLSFLFVLFGGVLAKNLMIHNANEFIEFAKTVNNGTAYTGTTVFLGNDIDFTGLSDKFEPVGNKDHPFLGSIDGQGHAISNIRLSSPSYRFLGFIGYSDGMAVRNVVVDGSCSFENSRNLNESLNYGYVSGIVGCCIAINGPCYVENSVNMASLLFSGDAREHELLVGGIGAKIHSINYTATIKNCANYGTLTVTGKSSGAYIGGIVGSFESGGKIIQNCMNYGEIRNNGTISKYLWIGGIIGRVSVGNASVENCVSTGKITTSDETGGIGSIIGRVSRVNENVTFTRCYWTSSTGQDGFGTSGYTEVKSETSQVTLDTDFLNNMNSYAAGNGLSKWILNSNKKKVTFKINNKEAFSLSTQLFVIPDLFGEESDNGKTEFDGWYTNAECTQKFTASEITKDTILYGLYLLFVSVTLDVNGGNGVSQTRNLTYGNPYGELPVLTKTGYTFGGWFSEKTGSMAVTSTTPVTASDSHTLYARWLINKYNLTFIYNNGDNNEVRTLDFNETIVYPENFEKAGYTFDGWSNKPERMPPESITTTALWTVNNYTIIFDLGNGDVIERTYLFNDTIEYPKDFAKEGYVFDGWNESVTFMPSHNLIITAQWIENSKYVKVLFGTTSLDKSEIHEVIRKYTDKSFVIELFDYDTSAETTLVIIKFNDPVDANKFVRAVKMGSESGDTYIRDAFVVNESPISFSNGLSPFFVISCYLSLFLTWRPSLNIIIKHY